MKVLKSFFVIIAILLLGILRAYPQGNTTNFGTEFWTAYMDHIEGAGPGKSQMSLYITSGVNTSGNVSVADGTFSSTFNILANQVTVVTIPATAFLGDAQGTFNKGIHITSEKPIAIYAHIYASSISGATLLLPVNTLGKDYYSINYTQASNSMTSNQEKRPSYSTFMVIGTQDNTTVEITPSVILLDGKQPAAPYTVNLKKGEVYQGLSAYDLTGTRIRSVSSTAGSCTKLAVFSGSSKIGIGCDSTNVSSDNLFQQVYPTASWGKNYITVPLKDRPYDKFRIALSSPNTNVKLNGVTLPATKFVNGFYYEFRSAAPNIISADKPIQVAQYAVSQGKTMDCNVVDNNDLGDPEMIFLNPTEQTIDKVTLYSTGNFRILKNYINVVIKTTAVPTFTLDGNVYTGFTLLPGNTLYSYARISVQAGTHTIKASEGFNAIAYGFGQNESYGYAAGTNLLDLNKYIVLNNAANNSTQTNGCSAVQYKVQVTLPYQTTNIKWDFKDGTTPLVDNSPVVKQTIKKGTQTLYVYEYPKPMIYSTGNYTVVATVFNPVGDDCGSNEDVSLDFNISDPPVAKFSSANYCIGDATAFKDLSVAEGNAIKTWLWDFGDNQTSNMQNPVHIYATAGDHLVTLTVGNENGCLSILQQKIHINSKPVASFKFATPDCIGQNILLADQSTAIDGPIAQWIWDYGDGSAAETKTDNKPFNHIYTNTGLMTVKLHVILTSGCVSDTYEQKISVSPLPVVDFGLPDVCLADAFAQFTDKSTIADNTGAEFTYQWNFGDANATSAYPNISIEKNPKHKYSQEGNYMVTLTVKSKYGCLFSKTLPFTVNGDTPRAGFVVENTNNLCSSNEVVFDDRSAVNFGNITKIVWYYDYNNNPNNSEVFLKDQIPADHKFHHNYGLFNSPANQNYAVVMRVYSGQTCYDESAPKTITIHNNPIITLSQLNSVCQEAGPVQITEDKNGFSGTGTFSGKGISSTGLFDPAVAGIGVTTINYIFKAQNGCDYTTSQQITVYPTPTASAGDNFTVLEGGGIAIKATASGNGLTYKWIPSIGLDHDNVLNPIASPAEDTNYKLTVTSADGCSATDEVFVRVLKYPVVPNAFTPNGDGINDTWNIKYLDSYPNNTVDIYNRYGEKLYSSIGYPAPWDGRYKGADLPAGAYYYIINPKNGRKTIAGSVTIIR
ncbi:MAG TPA: PKD domain-containing protein [Mucilaginibacter sp.]|nr:PKD domain-containing protein [Mucilaginibacter sp.]